MVRGSFDTQKVYPVSITTTPMEEAFVVGSATEGPPSKQMLLGAKDGREDAQHIKNLKEHYDGACSRTRSAQQ